MMSEEELSAIDDWRFSNRVATRSEAIRRLAAIAVVFDKEGQTIAQELSSLWRIREIGTDAILAELGPNPDWKNVAKKALATIAETIEPQTTLSERLFAILHQTALLKSSSDLRDGLAEAEKVKIASEERSSQIAAAFSQVEKNS